MKIQGVQVALLSCITVNCTRNDRLETIRIPVIGLIRRTKANGR